MNTPNNGFEGPESRLAGMVKGAVVCLLMAGAVLVGSGMHRDDAIAADASAPAATTTDAWSSGYFPAQFPASQGAPEPQIATF
jgi:hypothetical protein